MDYRKFYLAVRRYKKGRITRGEFYTEWVDAQYVNGFPIAPPLHNYSNLDSYLAAWKNKERKVSA